MPFRLKYDVYRFTNGVAYPMWKVGLAWIAGAEVKSVKKFYAFIFIAALGVNTRAKHIRVCTGCSLR